jgi:hypothetical protein
MRAILIPLLLLAACGQPVAVADNEGVDPDDSPAATVTASATPVRIGELGPNFQACAAAGTTRNLKAGESLPVRSAPFDNADQQGGIESGGRFFVCTSSLDRKWFGIVFDESGALADRCGVTEPVTGRRDYGGPCRSGWVQSAFVKLIAGDGPLPAVQPSGGNSAGP